MTHRFAPFAKFRRRPAKTPLVLFLLALAFQIAMPFTQAFADRFSWNDAETVVLCTGGGLKTFAVNADGSVTQLPDQTPQSSACEYCQVCPFGANGLFGLPQAHLFDYATETVASAMGPYGFKVGPRQTSLLLPATRGPPA